MIDEPLLHEPVFIVCAPRSCSTVVCAMLGMHPGLYGFPELNLFLTDTLEELAHLATSDTVPRSSSYWTGLLRAIAELRFGGQSSDDIQSARNWVTARKSWTTERMFKWLLTAVHPRIAVDKSPRTCLSVRCLRRALTMFPQARWLHLVRHPVATIRSLVQAHVTANPAVASGQEQARLATFYAGLWLQAQESILTAIQAREPRWTKRIWAEEILSDPASQLSGITRWLELPHAVEALSAMLHPENSPYACLPVSDWGGDGDPGFQRSPTLRLQEPGHPCLPLPGEWRLGPDLVRRLNLTSQILGYGPCPRS